MNLKEYFLLIDDADEYTILVFVTMDEFDSIKTELLKISPSFRKHDNGVFVFDHYNSEIILSTVENYGGLYIGNIFVGKNVHSAIYTQEAFMKDSKSNLLWIRTRIRHNVGESFKLLEKRNSEYEVVSL